jgi:prepilin-type N-terminal cleavage/methylation domain-containing protein
MKKRGFLLIELLVTIAILSGGLVLILAGFNSSLNALRTSQNIIRASEILEEKMWQLEQQAEEEEGIVAGEDEGEVNGFSWVKEVLPLEETALPQDESLWDEETAPILETALSEVKLNLHWREGSKERELSVITYLKSKWEEEWEKTEE